MTTKQLLHSSEQEIYKTFNTFCSIKLLKSILVGIM